ncbi:TPA: GntP family transporter, partial [Klebsiella pneumoniae]|nr:GntP family transporter [Klebsiella pneumoniae]
MLLLLVIKAKVQPFIALLLVSLVVALAAGIPAGDVSKVMIAGMGGVLGSVTIIIGLGAMLGRMIEHSGGAESLANYFSQKLGSKRTIAALTLAAFFLGIPVFFDVGFIILAPIIYGFAKVARLSPLKFGLPVAGIMLTVHVAVPPHPGPVAAAGLLHADIGWLTILGIAISILVGIVGYIAARMINKRQYALSVDVLEQMQLTPAASSGETTKISDKMSPPGVALVTALIVIPIAIIMAGTVSATLMPASHPLLGTLQLLGSPMVALMIALILAFWLLALRRGWGLQHTSDIMGSALPTAAVVILVTGAGGVFGKVLVESGVGKALASMLHMMDLPLL